MAHRQSLWTRVLDRFDAAGSGPMRDRFERFCREQAHWLDDFALFMAIKEAHGQAAWTAWEADIAHHDPAAIAKWATRCAREIRLHQLTQFLFFEQWQRVRHATRSVHIMGDLPIFATIQWRRRLGGGSASRDDADTTDLATRCLTTSATVSCGEPHCDGTCWQRRYAWVERFRALLTLVDRVRIDHFRGFEASWEVPANSSTAIHGTWVKGPGASLFDEVRSALTLEHLPFVAENLGVITPAVEALRRQLGLPGMAILQFAFGTDPQAADFRPHNYPRNLVVYTGTHDNDTTVG
jgi:4-alpha-glucanotransferase